MRHLFLAALAALSACATSQTSTAPLERSRQLVLVVAPDWSSTNATLRRFERRSGASWTEVGSAVPALLGRNGLAWGIGVHEPQAGGPQKREGDGKSPAGIFRFDTAFGFSETPAGIRMPYLELRDTTECVDDTSSAFYNRVVDRKGVPRVDWTSSEKMRTIPVYEWGAVILHNDLPHPGAGSCIFLHLSNGKPTSGCTAIDQKSLTAILGWLDPSQKPLFVQLTEGEYERLKGSWSLP